MPCSVASMFARCSAKRRRRMRSLLVGHGVDGHVDPAARRAHAHPLDDPRVPAPSGRSVKRHADDGSSGSPTDHSNSRARLERRDRRHRVPLTDRRVGVVARRTGRPSDGPVAPSSHSAPANSLLNRAGSWMSARAQRATTQHSPRRRAATTHRRLSTVRGSRRSAVRTRTVQVLCQHVNHAHRHRRRHHGAAGRHLHPGAERLWASTRSGGPRRGA